MRATFTSRIRWVGPEKKAVEGRAEMEIHSGDVGLTRRPRECEPKYRQLAEVANQHGVATDITPRQQEILAVSRPIEVENLARRKLC